MKIKIHFLAIFVPVIFLVAVNARAQVATNYYSQTLNTPIEDENPNGTNTAINVSGVVGAITGLSVFLNVTNGFNGDLYVYLDNPAGTQAILLNRVGVSAANTNAFGYDDSGFNLTFNLYATNDIHFYQQLSYSLNGGGQLTGTWAADGRNIDPLSSPPVFDSTSPTETLEQFLGSDPNGDWTLFLADMNGGYQSTLVDWGLQIETVPEPSSIAIFGTAVLGVYFVRRNRSKTNF